MTEAQMQLLRRMADQARTADCDIALGANVLAGMLDYIAALTTERDQLKAALKEIDHHEVGAYEVTWSDMPEPCEACVEMREIAEKALKS